ncbi:MAG TPA: copper resistance protein CopC [Caulobacteraceae bacterium]
MKERLTIALLGAAGLSLSLAAPAAAHSELESAKPAAHSAGRAPTEIRLKFGEGLVGKLCRIELSSPGGRPVPMGPVVLSPDHKVLSVSVKAVLAPGRYKVKWRVVSEDTHRAAGAYEFIVK